MADLKKTKEQIKDHLQWDIGNVLDLSALADIAEEEGDDDTAEKFRDSIDVAKEISELRKMQKEMVELFEGKNAKINQMINTNRRKCPHPIMKYYPDASGNNDSSTICLCCGEDI